MKKRELFKIEGNKIVRLRRHCPKCGEGSFLAEHKDRFSCGTCGYTEFKSGGKKTPEKPRVEKKKPVGDIKEETLEEQPPVEESVPKPEAPPIEEPTKDEAEQPSAEEPVKTEEAEEHQKKEEKQEEEKPAEEKKEESKETPQ